VVTFFDPSQFFQFVQDDTAASIFPWMLCRTAIAGGGSVGGNGRGGDSRRVCADCDGASDSNPGQGTFPAARSVTFDQLSSGQEDSQFVEIHGIVRAANFEETSGYFLVEIATGAGD